MHISGVVDLVVKHLFASGDLVLEIVRKTTPEPFSLCQAHPTTGVAGQTKQAW